MMEWTDILLNAGTYALIGAIAGLMAGILGLGGGLVVVPGLLYVFTKNVNIPSELAMHLATGTSLAIMIFTSSSAVKAHHGKGDILWTIYRSLWPGLVVGAMMGAIIADSLPSEWLQRIFGVFLLFIAWKLLINMRRRSPTKAHKPWLNRVISLIVGIFSGLLGVGGGTLVIPWLIHGGLSVRKAAPIAGLCSMTVAITGTIAVIISGWKDTTLPAFSTGYVYWPAVLGVIIPSYLFAPVGVRLTYILPNTVLKIVFIILVIMTAIAMLI